MRTSVVGPFVDAACANVLTATYVMAGFGFVRCVLELGFRGLVDPVLERLTPKSEKSEGMTEGSGISNQAWAKAWEMVDIRGELRQENSVKLLKNAARYLLIAFVVKEITDRIFGPPIQAFNLIGKFIGVQISPAGCHLPRLAEWRDALKPIAAVAV